MSQIQPGNALQRIVVGAHYTSEGMIRELIAVSKTVGVSSPLNDGHLKKTWDKPMAKMNKGPEGPLWSEYMAVEAVPVEIVSIKFPENGKSTGKNSNFRPLATALPNVTAHIH